MRAIHLARLDKTRPVLVLTRSIAIPHLAWVTVAPITSRIRGIRVEVPVGLANGLDQPSVVNLDDIDTIAAADLGRQIGRLLPDQEQALSEAVHAAFDLD